MIGLIIEAGLRQLCESIAGRKQVRHIPKEGGTYLSRFFLYPEARPEDLEGEERDDPFGVVLHHFQASDADHELHKHPWDWGVSIILTGGYREERRFYAKAAPLPFDMELPSALLRELANLRYAVKRRWFMPGSVNVLFADTFHRIDLADEKAGCWTLFIHGKRIQSWGFWNRYNDKFTPWREFVSRRGLRPLTEAEVEHEMSAAVQELEGNGIHQVTSAIEDEAFEPEVTQ